MCKPLDFQNDEHRTLLNRIASGEMVLFLGAGFSLGAIGNLLDEDTQVRLPIPGVKQLKEILCKKVLYRDEVDETLKEICEECQDDNESRYAQVMRDIFSVSEVADFHKMYADIEWKSIYTTNVDNVIERIYSEKKLYSICSENPVNVPRGALCCYKLHGDALHAPEKITFSTTDYITSAAKKNDCRFESLTTALKTENFLFVGTSLNEEWDFDIQCQQGNVYTVSNKAYFILKDYDEKLIKRIHRKFKNAVLIQETAESFICKVQEYLESLPKEKKSVSYEKWNMKRIQKQDYNVESYLKPNLYLGAEPTWEDIFSNHDVIWEKTQKVIEELKSENSYKCTLIVGKPVSGKTTMLYRLGATLGEDRMVLEYSGDNFFEDISSYLEKIEKDSEPTVILLDDANWILGRIDNIVKLLEESKIQLVITVREREYEKRQHLFDETVKAQIRIVTDISSLNARDIGRYLDKLNEKSFLGKYSKNYNKSREAAVASLEREIRDKKEDPLLRLAYKMKYGEELNKRIEEISDHIIENDNYNLKRFVVLLYFLDVIGDTGLKLSLFTELYPMNAEALKEFVVDIQDLMISNIHQKSWATSDYRKIIIHGRFSEIIKKAVKKIAYDELEEIVEDIFRRLDNVYHFKCRQSNSYQNYVLYTLLRSQNISELFRDGKNRKNEWKYISQLYENLHEYFGDYYLYWLHRGISEVKMKNYSSAQIHLEQARVSRKSYSYEIEHTFAVLYFEKAIHLKELSDVQRKELFDNALEIIRLQIGREENDAFSIHSFVIKSIQFYKSCKQEVPDPLMKDILNYYYQARKRFDLKQSIIRRNMLICIYQYLVDNSKEYAYNLSITQEELEYISRRIGKDKVDYDILDLM